MPLYPTSGTRLVNLNVTQNALGLATPANHGLIAWTYEPAACVSSSLLTNGTVYLSAVFVNKAASVTKIYWHVGAAGNTPISNQNKVGLYNSSGTLLQSTVVDSDVSSTGLKTTTITSQAVTVGAFYWVGFVFNASTAPTLARAGGLTGAGDLSSVGLSAAALRFATNGTSQTTLPSSVTPGSNSGTTFAGPWAAIAA
jgi:hypothetical protein